MKKERISLKQFANNFSHFRFKTGLISNIVGGLGGSGSSSGASAGASSDDIDLDF